jgi:hypothetical protein
MEETRDEKQEEKRGAGGKPAGGKVQSSPYEGMYVKKPGDPTYYLVERGKRRRLHTQQELEALGYRRVVVLPAAELEAIPLGRDIREGR